MLMSKPVVFRGPYQAWTLHLWFFSSSCCLVSFVSFPNNLSQIELNCQYFTCSQDVKMGSPDLTRLVFIPLSSHLQLTEPSVFSLCFPTISHFPFSIKHSRALLPTPQHCLSAPRYILFPWIHSADNKHCKQLNKSKSLFGTRVSDGFGPCLEMGENVFSHL